MDIKLDVRRVTDLRPYANNAKRHSDSDVELIAKSIQRYGFNDPIGILPDGTVVEGHGRLLAAQSLGLEEVPVLVLENFTERQANLYRIAHNKIALNGAFDFAKLAGEMRNLLGEGITFDVLGFTEGTANNILDMFGGEGIKAAFRAVNEVMPSYDIVWDDETQQKEWQTFVNALAAKGDGRTVTQQIIDMVEESGVLGAHTVKTTSATTEEATYRE